MTLRLIKSEYVEDINNYVSADELLKLSGLTHGQLRSLIKYELISKGVIGKHNKRCTLYPLFDVVYCRIYYELRQCFSNQFVKRILNNSRTYQKELLNKNYILVENSYEFVEFLDSIEDDVINKLSDRYLYSCNEKINDKLQGYIQVNRTYINLKDIRKDLYKKSSKLGIQNKLQRIA